MKSLLHETGAWLGVVLVLFVFVVQSPVGALSFRIGWQVSGKGGYSAANCLCDGATGKKVAFVAAEKNVGVVCLGIDGQRRWAYPMASPVTAAPAVADVNGDGAEEIVAADSKGVLVVLRDDGTPVWTAQLPGAVAADSCPAVTDVDGDGRNEILVGDISGAVSCLDSAGNLRWRFVGDGSQMGPVLAADIYDLPGKEIIVTSHDRCVYALSARGEWLWDLCFPNDLFPNTNPILADVDGDKAPELYIGGGLHHFYRVDLANPSVVFEENVYMHINGAINAADLDGDGRDEVVFGTKGGAVYAYAQDGFRWKRELGRTCFLAGPDLLALDGGATMPALFFGSEGSVYVFDASGKTLADVSGLPWRPIGTPLAGDLDNDGQTEVLVTSGDASGDAPAMFFAELDVPYAEDPRNRLVFAQDRAHTGRAPGAASYPLLPTPQQQLEATDTPGAASAIPCGETRLLSGPNTWRFDVENPSRQRLLLLVELQGPDGVVQRFARHIAEARERAVVSFPIEMPGEYVAVRRLLDADRRAQITSAKDSISFAGIDSDRSYLETVFRDTETVTDAWAGANARCARDVREELAALRGMLSDLCGKQTVDRTALMASLRDKAVRLNTLAAAGRALAPTADFLVWPFCPWAYFDPRKSLPPPERKAERWEVSLCGGEYGSLALNVTNITGATLDVRVQCAGVKGPGSAAPEDVPAGSHIAFRKAVVVPTTQRERVADALPALDEASILGIAPWESQQLWITVDAVGLAPGEYVADLRLKSIEPDPSEVHIPLDITVYDLALPRPRPLRFCTWPYFEGALSTGNDVALNDLVAHGETVFLAPSPTGACGLDGGLVGALDFAKHDKVVQRLSGHGMLLFLSPQDGLTGQPFLSEPWEKAFVQFVRAWVDHMNAIGLGYGGWAVYPYDEPSTPYAETTKKLVEVAKLVREADPNVLIYADPTSGTTMETAAMFTGLIDIWQPSSELLERLGPELIPEAKRVGKEVWFYDAAGNAKTLSCLGIYRWRFWYAWQQGLTGVGWWVYSQHGNVDRWDGPNPTGDFFASVYEGPRGPVSSKRWEVAREGVQDYERLYLLRQALQDAERRGVPEADLEEARHLLEQLPNEVESLLLRVGRRLPLTPDSVPLYEQATTTLDNARRQMAEMCLKLKTTQK